jgi:hypothetical protein
MNKFQNLFLMKGDRNPPALPPVVFLDYFFVFVILKRLPHKRLPHISHPDRHE